MEDVKMKKEYIKPQMKAVKIRHARMLMTSGGVYTSVGAKDTSDNDLGITYGGIDENGTFDPE